MKGKLLGSLESQIMDYYWHQDQPATISELHQHLVKNDQIAYTTVSTVVGRLVEKKLLKRSKDGSSFRYHCRGSKDDFLARTSRILIKNLLGSFGDVAVAGFVEELKGNPAAVKALKEIANEIE